MSKLFMPLAVLAAIMLTGCDWVADKSMPGYWQLNGEQSWFHFGSIKNGDIPEVHEIEVITGGADYSGAFSVELDLTTVDTGVESRDQRMKEMFFKTGAFPTARVNGNFDPALFEDMEVGQRRVASIPAIVSLHGRDVAMEFEVNVIRLEWNKIMVTPQDLIMVEGAQFGLAPGVEALREVVGLESITPVSPVSFVLVFDGSAMP